MEQLQKQLGYHFSEPALLVQALTHPSTAQKMAGVAYNNQRLEFLGDAVLGMMVADMLFTLYPDESEGDLSRRLVSLVNGSVLAEVAQQLGLGEQLKLSVSEADAGGRALASNLEDACEALLGAVYLDGGIEAVKPIIERFWMPLAKQNRTPPKDPKTALQEWAQGRGYPLPQYSVVGETGLSHAPEFTIEVSVISGQTARAVAGSKKQAERLAAESLLKQLG